MTATNTTGDRTVFLRAKHVVLCVSAVLTFALVRTSFTGSAIAPASGRGAISVSTFNGAYTALTGSMIAETSGVTFTNLTVNAARQLTVSAAGLTFASKTVSNNKAVTAGGYAISRPA